MTIAAKPLLVPKYFVVIRNWSGVKECEFDDWDELVYEKIIDDVGMHSFMKMKPDPRFDFMMLDSLLEVHRSIVGIGLNDYVDYIGFNRTPNMETNDQGLFTYTMTGVGMNSLLARSRIGYKGGTLGADKYAAAETAMKQYVLENCGYGATLGNGREIVHILPYFNIAPDNALGPMWQGSRPFYALLDVLKEISQYALMDYAVNYVGHEYGPPAFEFDTYPGQLGDDRTDIGIDPVTGLNYAGFAPVIFSKDQGNVIKAVYTYERTQESNVIFVLGEGQGATQTIATRVDGSAYDSPWNQCETSRPSSGFIYQLEDYGDAVLVELKAMEKFEFAPRGIKSCVYGKHYKLGDRVVVTQGGLKRYKRLTGVKVTVKDKYETLDYTFSDLSYAR